MNAVQLCGWDFKGSSSSTLDRQVLKYNNIILLSRHGHRNVHFTMTSGVLICYRYLGCLQVVCRGGMRARGCHRCVQLTNQNCHRRPEGRGQEAR